jgi:hypothetical protein
VHQVGHWLRLMSLTSENRFDLGRLGISGRRLLGFHFTSLKPDLYTDIARRRKRKAKWIGHVLRRNCLLQRVIEGKIQGGIKVTGRHGRRRRKLLDDLKERRGYSHLNEEPLDRTMWRAHFGREFGPVVRQTPK